MAQPRLSRLLLLVGAALLAASIFVPWVTLLGEPAGAPVTQVISPALILWNTLVATPDAAVRGGAFAVWSLVYLAATLEVIGFSLPLTSGRLSRKRVETFAAAILPGALICFFVGLLGGIPLFFALDFGALFTPRGLGVGALLAFLGTALALIGATRISMA